MKRDNLYIKDILFAISAIQGFVSSADFNHFDADYMRKSAVMSQLIIIGEASKNISEETKSKYPHIKWNQISGLRNFLVHEYFSIDWKIIWNTIIYDLPKLNFEIQEIVEKESLK